MEFPYLEAVIGFMILMYIFETYLDTRQHSALKLLTLPKTLEGVISQEKFEKSRAYSLEKSHFHFVHEFVTILMDSAILFFRVLPWFWKKSGDFVVLAGLNAENEILHTLAFLAGVTIWSQITDLPFSLYSTFVVEARHGFNKQTIWLFFRDMLKGICLMAILGPPIVAAIIVIVQKGGAYLAIYLWGFMFVLSLVMMTIYPILIAPLFNKFTPLPEGALREKIEKLASSLQFPLKKLFIVDGSTRSSHSNFLPASPMGSHRHSASESSSFESSDFDQTGVEELASERSLTNADRHLRNSQHQRSSVKSEKTIDTLRRVCGNDKCADCGASEPDWASLNLGVLVCIECSGVHRNLGVHISKVRSLTLDVKVWEPSVINLFQSLGNTFARGADPRAPNGEGKTPLELAVESNFDDGEVLNILSDSHG